MFPIGVGFSLIDCKLFSSVFKVVHPKLGIEAFPINPVLPLDLAVMPWRRRPDPLIDYSAILEFLLKQSEVILVRYPELFSELRTVVRLHSEYFIWERIKKSN